MAKCPNIIRIANKKKQLWRKPSEKFRFILMVVISLLELNSLMCLEVKFSPQIGMVLALTAQNKNLHFKRTKESRNNKLSLKLRLLREVNDSINTAAELRDSLSISRNISIHADISENKKNKSNIVCDQAKNWIKAMGFDCKMKPISWASSSIADLHAK